MAYAHLYLVPKVLCVELSRKVLVDVHDVDVSLCHVADDGLVVFACRWVGLDVDAEGAVELQFQPARKYGSLVWFLENILFAFRLRALIFALHLPSPKQKYQNENKEYARHLQQLVILR